MRNIALSLLLTLLLAVLPLAEAATASPASHGPAMACAQGPGGGKTMPVEAGCLTCCILPVEAMAIASPAIRRAALHVVSIAPLAGIEPAATSPPPRVLG